ncbi:MAG: sugar transferase [Oscillospiraceae bacterium]|nr:sugar transferase [Oscillospiraceae bacterium]
MNNTIRVSGASLSRDEYVALKEKIEKASDSNRRVYWVVKRFFDIVLSFVAILVLSPVFLIVALAIYIDDPKGSPFFVQTRVGRHGKKFKFYKFRSMVSNAEELLDQLKEKNEKDGPVFKMKDDPRITRIGKFIRKTSIDELPQLFNILKGDMSIVGPRPSLPKEVSQYNDYQAQRLFVTPGLTCYWQASKKRDDISFDEWVDLDIKYILERSWFVDIKLIFKTFIVVFTGQGE